MSAFGSSVAVLSCSLFVAALIKLLAPLGKCEKIMRFVISLFVLLSLVTSVKAIADEIKPIINNQNISEEFEHINSKVNNEVLKVTGDYIAEYINNMLSSNNINCGRIEVTVNADDNNVISITDICIYIDKTFSEKNKATEIIEKDLKIIPRFEVYE